MNREEILLVQSKHNAAIIAPAGHGKTEMITDLAEALPGKKLILTHTNAGVAALAARLNRKKVSKDKYSLSTISSFCIKWCGAYPSSANVDTTIQMTDGRYYSMIHSGTAKIFAHEWARNVIKRTYDYVIVDEYQDCVLDQHQIFVELNKTVPVYVLGDPLQAIFGFKERLVSWKNICFERLDDKISTYPWRWENTNPSLGQYLNEVRQELLPGLDGKEVPLSTVSNGKDVYRINPANLHSPEFYNVLKRYSSVLYIAKWEDDTTAFARNTGGLFQNDEAQNLKVLYKYAKLLDSEDGSTRTKGLFNFLVECASGVTEELKTYRGRIFSENYDFSLIREYPDFGRLMLQIKNSRNYDAMLSLLQGFKSEKAFRVHRLELFMEMQRSIMRARDKQTTINAAAQEIRMIPGNQSRYSGYTRLSSRTLLSKGLEFDCVIIDLTKVSQSRGNRYSATEMYVAMTRAMKSIYFLTNQDSVLLSVPNGVN